MKWFKTLFNTNTGYFIDKLVYYYEGEPYLGYILCQGYVLFVIPGYDRVGIYCDKESLLNSMKILGIKLEDCKIYLNSLAGRVLTDF